MEYVVPLGPFSSSAFSRVELVLAYPGDLPWNGDQSHELFFNLKQICETCSKSSEMEDQISESTQKKMSLRKYSHPGYNSPPDTPRLSPRVQRRKKHSLPCNSLTVINPYEDGDVTKSLESAVRKISRGSSPNCLTPEIYSGLSGLAKGYEQYRESLTFLRPSTEFGEPSSDDLSSEWDETANEQSIAVVNLTESLANTLALNAVRRRQLESSKLQQSDGIEENNNEEDEEVEKTKAVESCKKAHKRPSGWRKVRNMVQWTPFIQEFKNRKYQWVQLAGHSGNFKAGRSQGTVLKKLCPQEEHCYNQFSQDSLAPFVPEYQGTICLDNDEKFIQLQDCLSTFVKPSIMDCKIGVRTYLEEELAKAKEKPKLRKDMFEKMIAVDPLAPTEEERKMKGVTKPRYMVWRETISSTATLGFRIEGVKKSDGTSSKEFKTTKTRDQVIDSFSDFLSSSVHIARQYLERLQCIKKALSSSDFFSSHELIGSSLLFVHDSSKACVWLIDFGKTVPLPDGLSIDHKTPWVVGNHEDGYLIGVDNLISIFTQLVTKLES